MARPRRQSRSCSRQLVQPRRPMVTDGRAGGRVGWAFSQGPHAEGRGSRGRSSLLVQGSSLGKMSAGCEEQERVLPATSQH